MLYNKDDLESLQHRWSTPKGKELVKVIKKTRCYLSPVLFRDKINNFPGINDKEVEDGIDLRGCPLAGFDFRVPVQEDDEGFSEDIAILSNIHFEGAMLKHCNFQDGKIHDCHFENADLTHTEFKNSTLNTVNFQEADLSGLSLNGAKIISCNFTDSIIKDMSFGTAVIDQKSTFGLSLRSEKDKNYHFAAIEYKQIKEVYKNSSLHAEADQFHYKEMVAKRKDLSIKNPARWFSFLFGDLLCKYGTSFIRVLFASALLIFACAFAYTHNNSLFFYNQPVPPSLATSLYFSAVSFTTLGYGDYHAIGNMRFLAASEGFIGSALMALFTVIVARNLIRD